jgi:hypothetical protein
MGTEASIPTLDLVNEEKIYKLLDEFTKNDLVEASGIVRVDDHFYVVFDNDSRIAKLNCDLSANGNSLVGRELKTYGFEGITYNPNEKVFYALIESQKVFNIAGHFAFVNTYNLDFNLLNSTRLEWEFSNTNDDYNKGFEGISFVNREEKYYLLCLCEGNLCQGGSLGKEPGNGIIQVFTRGSSVWEHVAEIKIPPNVKFKDYSGMDIHEYKIVIVSQMSSSFWIGDLNISEWKFKSPGKIYQFPRKKSGKNRIGKKRYGNVEGVAWIPPNRVVVVSDKRKDGKPKRYKKKDQSIHIFKLQGEY